jgi:hypothetical protein
VAAELARALLGEVPMRLDEAHRLGYRTISEITAACGGVDKNTIACRFRRALNLYDRVRVSGKTGVEYAYRLKRKGRKQ